jgi:hypothetical protein
VARDIVYPSDTINAKTGCGDMFVHILYTDETKKHIFGVRADLGKSGGCSRSHLAAKEAVLNGLFHNVKRDAMLTVLIAASGHNCQFGKETCHDVLFRIVIDAIMKEPA